MRYYQIRSLIKLSIPELRIVDGKITSDVRLGVDDPWEVENFIIIVLHKKINIMCRTVFYSIVF